MVQNVLKTIQQVFGFTSADAYVQFVYSILILCLFDSLALRTQNLIDHLHKFTVHSVETFFSTNEYR